MALGATQGQNRSDHRCRNKFTDTTYQAFNEERALAFRLSPSIENELSRRHVDRRRRAMLALRGGSGARFTSLEWSTRFKRWHRQRPSQRPFEKQHVGSASRTSYLLAKVARQVSLVNRSRYDTAHKEERRGRSTLHFDATAPGLTHARRGGTPEKIKGIRRLQPSIHPTFPEPQEEGARSIPSSLHFLQSTSAPYQRQCYSPCNREEMSAQSHMPSLSLL